MAASSEPQVGRNQGLPAGRPAPTRPVPRSVRWIAAAVILAVALWFFPLVRVVPLNRPAADSAGAGLPAAFDAATTAAKIWRSDLTVAAGRALELKTLVGPLRENAEAAKAKFAKSAGLGAAYYFVRGSGRVVARERNTVRVALDGDETAVVALRIGPVFGNTVRDGCGFLDVNAFPGLQEFNALSAELNALVEKNVLPALRERAQTGATIEFAGCAEAPESMPDAGEPLLLIVPVQAEVR